MPWHLSNKHPDCSGWAVVKDSNNSVVGCHATKTKAQKQLAALNANVQEGSMKDDRLPREDLYRAMPSGGYEIRDDEDGTPRLFGHFAVFDQWTEIKSIFEGHFLERMAPGSLKKTLGERTQRILFNHGRDPDLGNKVLAPLDILREDDTGGFYDSPLLEGIPSLLINGLREGVYGASFRFRVLHEELQEKPKRSEHNPDGLPERSIKEAEVMEFGPVTFPAYAGATSGVRSLTDEYRVERLLHEPDHLARVIEFARDGIWQQDSKANQREAGEDHSPEGAGQGHFRKVSVDAFLERRANG